MLLNDGSSKTLMVDERQNVRDVLDNLFEKTHCDCNVDWSLCETNPELHLGRWRRLKRSRSLGVRSKTLQPQFSASVGETRLFCISGSPQWMSER